MGGLHGPAGYPRGHLFGPTAETVEGDQAVLLGQVVQPGQQGARVFTYFHLFHRVERL
ncbi:MAG: hypothetical protein ACPL7C_04750 [Anaerolineae bacterium]